MQQHTFRATPVRLLAAVAAAAWLAIYLPDAGRGFIKDDFAWLVAAPLAPSPWDAAWTASTGFFRPLVSLSFTANYALFGTKPLGYGLTNVVLAIGCAAVIFMLARAWRIPERGALIASGIWLFTPHGMDMAVLWISGRSSLLLVLFAVLACWAAARQRNWLAIAAVALALLAKEDAAVVPVLAALSLFAARRSIQRADVVAAGAIVLALIVYFWMRSQSGAMTPWSAPVEYRPSLDPRLLGSNLAQYADRLLTFPLAVVLAAWVATGSKIHGALRERPVLAGVAWAAVAMIPTIALPVRSSLYVLLALAGISIAAAALIERLLHRAAETRARAAAIVLLVIAAVLIPVHRSRQHEWSDAARLSASVVAGVAETLREAPEGSRVIARDRFEQPNLESTFGNLLPEMLQVVTGKRFEVVHAPPGPSLSLTPVPR